MSFRGVSTGFFACCALVLALAFPQPASAMLISAVSKAGGIVKGTMVDICLTPDAGGPIAVPFPNLAIAVKEGVPGKSTVATKVGVNKTASFGAGSTITIDYDTHLLEEEGAKLSIMLLSPNGAFLGPAYGFDVDTSGAGSVTFNLTDLPLNNVVLEFAFTMLDSDTDIASTFDISRVEIQGATLTEVPVPEPTSLALFGIAVVGFAVARKLKPARS